MNERELKLTAALYASRPDIVDHVRRFGRLPKTMRIGGADIGMRLLIRKRGTDIQLTEDEQLVYDALLRSGRTPGGRVVLLPAGESRVNEGDKKVGDPPLAKPETAERSRKEREARWRRMRIENMRRFAGQSLTAVFDTARGQGGEWRVRGSGVFGQPESCEQTAVIVTACEESGIPIERHSNGSPANANSYTLAANFLDGGLRAQTGNYMFGKRGAWVIGARAMLFVALKLQLRTQDSLLHRLNLSHVTLENLKNELRGV